MKHYLVLGLLLAGTGCHMSPVPERISQYHQQAQREVPVLEQMVQPGDILFRLSHTELAGGLIDFSKTVAKCTDSQMSHAALIYHVGPDGAMLVDITPTGIQRRYMMDWYMDGTDNLVIRRLKPQYQFLVPKVLAELDKLVARHVLYDQKFDPNNDRYYCTELVDHCFRVIGYPLAPMMRIKDFPRYDLLMSTGCLVGGINVNNKAAFVGNDRIGLFSSPMLETVVDLRGHTPDEIEKLLPQTQLVEREYLRGPTSSEDVRAMYRAPHTGLPVARPVAGPAVQPDQTPETTGWGSSYSPG